MPNIQKPTIKQHYVPQVYLKGFSQDKKRIYRYDLSNETQKLVPISSICYKDNLYEFNDKWAKTLGANYIEKIFCEFEAQFSIYINKLKKIIYEEFKETPLWIFDTEVDAFWVLYIAIQMLRSPWVLDLAKECSEQYFNKSDEYTDEIKTLSLLFCFPFLKSLSTNEYSLLNALLNTLTKLSIVIGIDRKGRIFTSDDPVYCDGLSLENIEKVIFPLSSNIVIFLLDKDYIDTFGKILFFEINDYDIKEITSSISYNAHLCILSKYLLNETELKQIKESQLNPNPQNSNIKSIVL